MRSNSSELRSLTLGSLECTDPVFFPFTKEVFCLLLKVWMANEKSRGVPASETHCGDKRAAEQRLGRGRQAC